MKAATTIDDRGEDGRSASVKPLANSRKSATRRAAIIRAAIEVINAKSYALATMSDIAASLDLSDGTLYYYFPNKRALVYACHIASLERFEALLAGADCGDGTGAGKLRHFIADFFAESGANGPQLYFGDHSYLEADQRAAIDAWAGRLTLRLRGFIVAGVEDGSIMPCEPDLVVQLLLGMFIWLAKWVPSIGDLDDARLTAAVDLCTLAGLERKPGKRN